MDKEKMLRTMEDMDDCLDKEIAEAAEKFMEEPTYNNLKVYRKLLEADKMTNHYLEMRTKPSSTMSGAVR